MNRYYSLYTKDNKADLYIFGEIMSAAWTGLCDAAEIDFGDVSGLSIVQDLNALDKDIDTVNVHINSPGGLTFEGLAIYNTLKSHPAKVITYCEGIAASAASIVFMAGDERIMSNASMLMIHNAWTQTAGNAAQLEETAKELQKISEAAANAYMAGVNITREELDAMLDGENHEGTWILPEDAVKMGFATYVIHAKKQDGYQSCISYLMDKIATPKQEIPVPQEEKKDPVKADIEHIDEKQFTVAQKLFNLKKNPTEE